MKKRIMQDPEITELDNIISNVDWDKVSEKNRVDFISAVSTIHITTNVKTKISAICAARRNSFMAVLVSSAIMLLLSFELITIFVTSLVIQMLFFAYSQVLEFGTDKIFQDSKNQIKALVKGFPKLENRDE